MGNIKAQPATIRKISDGSIDNDFSIMLEEYHATEYEYSVLDKQLQNTGFSIGAIGNITLYINSNYKVYASVLSSKVSENSVFEEINKELQLGLIIITG